MCRLNRSCIQGVMALVAMLLASTAGAVTAVNPFGVNVRASGPTTVFLTFQSLDPGETAVEAFWCGELQAAVLAANPTLQLPFAVQTADPCVPSSVYGRLPLRLDRSRPSASAGVANFTDVMTIPASVARRAFQDAQAGLNSAFFYVRRFTGGAGGDKYVIVTCRMAGGGARVALALMNVRVAFEGDRGTSTVLALARGERPPPFVARIQYNGAGALKGRWEVQMPGDVEPTDEDLLTEATLPVERRALQRRYTLLDRFEIFLPPTGDAVIPGVDPKRLPTLTDGAYKVLLRIEASDDKEADSNTGGGRIVHAGGVAGFPMPVLRYFVGSGETLSALALDPRALQLVAPAPDRRVGAGDALVFGWVEAERAELFRLEIELDGRIAFSAVVKPGTGSYAAPPFLREQLAGRRARWRVVALDARGEPALHSEWRAFAVE